MSATLQQVIAQIPGNTIKCIAGFKGMEKEILGFSVLDTPEILSWLKGGELLVSAGYVLINNPSMMDTLIRDLSKKGCVGLGVKVKRYFDKVPQILIDQGNKYDFPILEMPYSIRFADFSKALYQNLFHFNLKQSENRAILYQQILDAVLSDDVSTEHLLYDLSRPVSNPIFLLDDSLNLITYENPGNNSVKLENFFSLRKGMPVVENAAVRQVLTQYANTGFSTFVMERYNKYDQLNTVFFSICIKKQLKGFIMIPEMLSILNTDQYNMIVHIASLIGFHLLKIEKESGGAAIPDGSILSNVLLNPHVSEKEILYYCDLYRFNVSMSRICLNFRIPGYQKLPYDKRIIVSNAVSSTVERLTSASGQEHFDVKFNDSFMMFLFFQKQTLDSEIYYETREFSRTMMRALSNCGVESTAGISGCYRDVIKIPVAFKQAVDLEQMGGAFDMSGEKIYSFDSLRTYYTMYCTMTECQLQALYDDTIAELVCYDRENNGEYVETLKMYIENKFNITQTAVSMHVHRNTLMYRLERIREILSLDIESHDDLLGMQLGLYAMSLLNYIRRTDR